MKFRLGCSEDLRLVIGHVEGLAYFGGRYLTLVGLGLVLELAMRASFH